MTSYTIFSVCGTELLVNKAPDDGRPHLASKIIRSGHGVSYVTPDGVMFSSRVSPGKWYVGKRWTGRLDIVRDAIALGVLPDKKKAVAALVKAEGERKERQAKGYAAKDAIDGAKRAGVSLPPVLEGKLKVLIRAARK